MKLKKKPSRDDRQIWSDEQRNVTLTLTPKREFRFTLAPKVDHIPPEQRPSPEQLAQLGHIHRGTDNDAWDHTTNTVSTGYAYEIKAGAGNRSESIRLSVEEPMLAGLLFLDLVARYNRLPAGKQTFSHAMNMLAAIMEKYAKHDEAGNPVKTDVFQDTYELDSSKIAEGLEYEESK